MLICVWMAAGLGRAETSVYTTEQWKVIKNLVFKMMLWCPQVHSKFVYFYPVDILAISPLHELKFESFQEKREIHFHACIGKKKFFLWPFKKRLYKLDRINLFRKTMMNNPKWWIKFTIYNDFKENTLPKSFHVIKEQEFGSYVLWWGSSSTLIENLGIHPFSYWACPFPHAFDFNYMHALV